MNIGTRVIIPKGWGYWDTTEYPIGGAFRRAPEDLHGTVKRVFKLYHSTDCEILLDNGRKAATRSSELRVED